MTDSSKTTEILERLERVEAALAGMGHNNGGPPLDDPSPLSDPDLEAQDRRLSTTMVAKRYGVVPRSVERWLLRSDLNFPKPDIVNKRRYWWLSVLREWDHARLRQSMGSK